MVLIHQRHRGTDRQTDGQTDGQTDDMRSQDRALHYSALHGKNDLSYQQHKLHAKTTLSLTLHLNRIHFIFGFDSGFNLGLNPDCELGFEFTVRRSSKRCLETKLIDMD